MGRELTYLFYLLCFRMVCEQPLQGRLFPGVRPGSKLQLFYLLAVCLWAKWNLIPVSSSSKKRKKKEDDTVRSACPTGKVTRPRGKSRQMLLNHKALDK